MTEDEARELNRMSARIAALQLLTTWLLYKSLKDAVDPDELASALLAKAQAGADTAMGQSEELRAAFVEEFEIILRQSLRLLEGR